MSYKLSTLIYGGLFVAGITYASASLSISTKDSLKKEVLRSSELTLCDNKGICIELDKSTPLPDTATIAPLGVEYALNQKEVKCLAQQIHQEAVRTNPVDKAAVGHATINRVMHSEYPNTICGVISYERCWKGKCRFDMSWYGNKTKRYSMPPESYVDLARDIIKGEVTNPIGYATNWYNANLDSKGSFNYRMMMQAKNAAFKIPNSPHFFIEIR